jgi:pyruvate/2-oxoglutarate dehydrogenase complex dihydrolipoamide acyltransferase (E2) component
MTDYKYVGRHLDDLHDGRVVAPGQTVDLDDRAAADPHNAQRIQAGLLIPVQQETDIDATEEAKQLAAQKAVDLRDVTGSGKDGRVLIGDVETYIHKREGND